jgi:hypothetical protein
MDARLAAERLPQNIKRLSQAVDALEQLLQRAETLKEPSIERALPFIGLFLLYASGMRDLLNSRRRDGRMLWNAPALAALCRPLQDSFLGFFYFGVEQVSDDEASFRDLLLRRHHNFKRADLLTRADQTVPEIAAELVVAREEAEVIQQRLIAHPFFATLPPEIASEVKGKRDRFIFEPLQDTWQRAGLPPELYEVIFRYLSQWVHATPYALGQMPYHRADHENGAVNMNIPVGLALSCTCLVLDRTARLAAPLEELLPKGFRKFFSE